MKIPPNSCLKTRLLDETPCTSTYIYFIFFLHTSDETSSPKSKLDTFGVGTCGRGLILTCRHGDHPRLNNFLLAERCGLLFARRGEAVRRDCPLHSSQSLMFTPLGERVRLAVGCGASDDTWEAIGDPQTLATCVTEALWAGVVQLPWNVTRRTTCVASPSLTLRTTVPTTVLVSPDSRASRRLAVFPEQPPFQLRSGVMQTRS